MRFRAKIISPAYFLKIVQTIEKNGKNVVMGLRPQMVHFFLVPDSSGVKIWGEVQPDSLFSTYTLESKANNCIYLELDISVLGGALRSCQRGQDVVVKLTKKDQLPFLNFRIKPRDDCIISQDVPVAVLSDEDFGHLIESPPGETPEVQIMLPPLKNFHDIVDRYKTIGNELVVVANMDGRLSIRMETSFVTMATFYRDLAHPTAQGQDPLPRDPDKRAEVRVDIKKFVRILRSYQLTPTNVIACLAAGRWVASSIIFLAPSAGIFDRKALALHVLLDRLYMTFLIPVVQESG